MSSERKNDTGLTTSNPKFQNNTSKPSKAAETTPKTTTLTNIKVNNTSKNSKASTPKTLNNVTTRKYKTTTCRCGQMLLNGTRYKDNFDYWSMGCTGEDFTCVTETARWDEDGKVVIGRYDNENCITQYKYKNNVSLVKR